MRRIFPLLFLLFTSCNSQSSTKSLEISPVTESQSTTLDLFPVLRNGTTAAEAAAAIGCMGDAMSAPVNLAQYDDNPSFESLFSLNGRPWLVKLEEAGVVSGRLTLNADANQDWMNRVVREYDMSSEAFSIAGFLDARWLPLSSIWRDSLSYGLERVNAGQKDIDAAYETLNIYGPEIESICKIAVLGVIQKAQTTNLPTSTYVYIQTSQYLPDWLPESFTVSSLEEFTAQFQIQEN
jgi:hypothetical protein